VSSGGLVLASRAGRLTLAATALGSGMAFLDSTVVNVALPTIAAEFGAGFSQLQWILDAYLLTLAALLLPGGALGDRYGRRTVFLLGLVGFTAASALCGLAPSAPALIGARAVQGVGGALLVPASLALVSTVYRPEDTGRAIGLWSGLSGVSTAVGPLLGGWLVDEVSWRLVFLINLPLAVVAAVAARAAPHGDRATTGGVDWAGAVLSALGLGGVVFVLIEGPLRGWDRPLITAAAVLGVLALAGFVVRERRARSPMLPFAVFRSRRFTVANLVTLALYAALTGALFLVVLQLRTVVAYSALAAGASLLPLTLLLLVLSPAAGDVARRVGPRPLLTAGPLAAAGGLALLAQVDAGATYWRSVLPGASLLGLGLGTAVAPLTATVVAAVATERVGLAAGVNNVVARLAGLLAVAVLPLIGGISAAGARGSDAVSAGYERAMLAAAALCVAAALIAVIGLRGDPQPDRSSRDSSHSLS
jgi:EmrB/QacA subfamily drug resistance transporter